MTQNHLQLALNLHKEKQFEAALKEYLAVISLNAQNYLALYNAASCYLELGMIDHAKDYYTQALSVNNGDPDCYYNLGVIAMRQQSYSNANRFFQQCLSLDKHYTAAITNLGAIALKLGQTKAAIQYYQEALANAPNNTTIQYMLSALHGDNQFDTPPIEYIENLFDNYANYYDEQMQSELSYRLPNILSDTLSTLALKPNNLILDLGCGTGLCGKILKSYANVLIGMDISHAMLQRAQRTQLYDQLIQGNIQTELASLNVKADIIIAADVINYLGELSTFLSACQISLTKDGYLIFTTEISTQDTFEMTTSGRYRHSEHYIKTVTKKANLLIEFCKIITPRKQNNQPVQCHLWVLKK